MRRNGWVLSALLGIVLGSLPFAVPAQARPTSPTVTDPAVDAAIVLKSAVLHGRHATLVAAKGAVADTALARVSAANQQVGRIALTNPCFGLGVLCLFEDANGGGRILIIDSSALFLSGYINLTTVSLGSGNWNDKMSSWSNDIGGSTSAATMCWWVNTNGGGAGHLMRPLGATVQNLLSSENNKASSVDTQNTTCH